MEHISYGIFNNCYGSYIFDNQDKYVGEWKNDKPHGQGTYTYSNGKIEEGTWKEGILVKAQTIQKTVKTYKEYIMRCPVGKSMQIYKLVNTPKIKKQYTRMYGKWVEDCEGPNANFVPHEDGAVCIIKASTGKKGEFINMTFITDYFAKTYSQKIGSSDTIEVQCKDLN